MCVYELLVLISFLNIIFNPHLRICLLILEREERRGGERERDVKEKYRLVASHTCPDQDQTHNLGMCPDWGSNRRPLGAWDDGPTN